MLKADFLRRLGIFAAAAPIAAGSTGRAEAADGSDVLIGLWEAVIDAEKATYRYVYSMSRGSYVCTGNVDENFSGFKFGPTMGAYVRNPDGSYKYRERGYVFDMKGNDVGTFTSEGTFRLEAGSGTFRGPGTFTQFDLHSKPIARERFTMTATRVPV
jgi:hypothetical protein